MDWGRGKVNQKYARGGEGELEMIILLFTVVRVVSLDGVGEYWLGQINLPITVLGAGTGG